jgi:RNA polymerase sigma factor (sigma-70 family)
MADSGINRVVRHIIQAARGRSGGELSDGQLLEWFLAARAEDAFEALVHRHGPMVLGVCRRVLGHVHDAEDAFQATFLILLRKGAGVWPRAKVGNWLYGVAYRIALKARAARGKRQSKEMPAEAATDMPAPPREPGRDWLPLLDRELHGLPAKYRIPIVLCDLQGKSQHDAARQLGWREGTLSGRLSRARVLLGRRLARRGFTITMAGLTAGLSAQAAVTGAVPPALSAATIKALGFTATKQAVAAGVISAQAAALSEGVLQTMLWNKIKAGVVVLLAAAVVTTGLGRSLYTASGQSQGPEGGAGAAPRVTKVEAPSRKAKELETKLAAAGSFAYKDRPLGEVLDDLRNKHGINIFVDTDATTKVVDAAGAEINSIPVSVVLKDVPLETALRYLMKSAKLGFVNQDGVVVVTSRDKAMIRKVYPVGALLGKDEDKNAVALMQAIINSIEPETWSFVSTGMPPPVLPVQAGPAPAGGGGIGGLGGIGGIGGLGQVGFGGGALGMMGAGPPQLQQPVLPVNSEGGAGQGGSIAYFPGTKSLVVRHSFEVHREIEELLSKLAEK